MPRFATGTVEAVTSQRRGLQRVIVDARPAYVLTELIGAVAVGDRVVVNTTALDRALGTGGADVVHWNLSTESLDLPGRGHVMKARYLSLQHDAGSWDIDDGPGAGGEHDVGDLVSGAVVIGCQLHSHVGAVCAGLAAGGRRVGFVMTDTAALPLALSDLIAALDDADALVATATCGQSFGGTHEAVTVASGVAAMVSAGADVVVVGPGPGHVGTSDPLAFSGLSLASELDLLAHLGAKVALATRWSSVDQRARHQGLSHHSHQLLSIGRGPWTVPVAHVDDIAEIDAATTGTISAEVTATTDVQADVVQAAETLGIDVSTMGRRLGADAAAIAALNATVAWVLHGSGGPGGSTSD